MLHARIEIKYFGCQCYFLTDYCQMNWQPTYFIPTKIQTEKSEKNQKNQKKSPAKKTWDLDLTLPLRKNRNRHLDLRDLHII